MSTGAHSGRSEVQGIDGAPVAVTVGNIRDDDEVLVLCDTTQEFLRRYSINDLGIVTVTDTELDGTTPYVPIGSITNCGSDASIDGLPFEQIVCLSDGSVASRYTRVSVTSGAILQGPDFRNAETGAPIALGGRTVVPCSGQEVEVEILCDTGAADLSFLRALQYGVDGSFTSATDTTLDGTTPYVAVGPVTRCTGGGSGSGLPTILPCPMCDLVTQNTFWATENNAGSSRFGTVNLADGTFTPLIASVSALPINALAYIADERLLYGRVATGGGLGNVFTIDPFTLAVTNPGITTGVPVGNFNYGAYDPKTKGWYVGGSSGLPAYLINRSTLVATQATSFNLPVGAGDMAFDECGRLYILASGALTRFESLADASGYLITTVPDNGSGFSGAGVLVDGFFFSTFNDGEMFKIDIRTSEYTTGLGPISSGNVQFDWASDPRAEITFSFKRIFDVDAAGVITGFNDIDVDGSAYTPVGDVTFGDCLHCCSDCEQILAVTAVVTTLVSGGTFTTSPQARRVQSMHEGQSSTVGLRDTVNGSALADLGGNGMTLNWGDLVTGTRVPPIAFVPGSGNDIFVSEEI